MGAWRNLTQYYAGQIVIDPLSDSTMWKCLISHISAAQPTSFADDRAAKPFYWQDVTGVPPDQTPVGTFLPLTGGTITGNLAVQGLFAVGSSNADFQMHYQTTDHQRVIQWINNGTSAWQDYYNELTNTRAIWYNGTDLFTVDSGGNTFIHGELHIGWPEVEQFALHVELSNNRILQWIATPHAWQDYYDYASNSRRFWNNMAGDIVWFDGAGNIFCRSVIQSSDYRLKIVHGPIQDVGGTIDDIRIYDGSWKGAPHESSPMLLAHELAEVCPWAVAGEKDAVNAKGEIEPQTVDYSSLIPMLIAEIQSLRRRITELESIS